MYHKWKDYSNPCKDKKAFAFVLFLSKLKNQLSVKIVFLKLSQKFTGINLCWSLFWIKFQASTSNSIQRRPRHRCFPVNFAKIFKNIYFVRLFPTTGISSIAQHRRRRQMWWGNCPRFVVQTSSPAMNIKFWHSSSRFIAQPLELSFMSEKM